MALSQAYANFRSSLSLAAALVSLEKRYQDPPPSNSTDKALGLRGGAAILCVAAFETFLRDLFIERFTVLTTQPPPVDFKKLPEKVRITSVWESLQQAMRGPRGSKTEKLDRLAAVLSSARVAGAEIVAPMAFSETNANPGPETVKDMFRNAGVSEVFKTARPKFDSRWPKPEAVTFVEDKLNEIVVRRNAVAHTIDVRKITRDQLNESLHFLVALAESLDEVLEEHIDQLLQTCAP